MRTTPVEVLSQLSYQDHGEVPATYQLWKIEMNRISRVIAKGDRYSDDWRCSCGCALYPEQNGVVWMKGVTRQFMLPGQTVLEPSTETLPTVEAGVLPPRYHPSVGCEVGTGCINEKLLGVMEMFVGEILNEESDIVSVASEHAAEKVMMSVIDSFGAQGETIIIRPEQSVSYTVFSHTNYALLL